MLMIIIENLNELRWMEPIHFSDDIDLSQRNATMYFFIVILALYKLIFGSTMPRIGGDLKLLLQGSME